MDAQSITALEPLLFSLPPALTIENVDALAGDIAALTPDDSQTLVLDASAVEHITTPGIQLILVLGLHRAKHGGQLQLLTPTTPLVDAFLGLGLGAELQALGG